MKFYQQPVSQVEQELKTTFDKGLSKKEAQLRLKNDGANVLAAGKKKSWLMRLLDQFKDSMIIVLIVAAILSGVVAGEWADAAIIMIVVILNGILGMVQESRSEAAIEALKELSTPTAHVRRNGEILQIPSSDLVPGDVVLLEAGDVVPADIRLVVAESLKIEEAALTGESVPVDKKIKDLPADTALADRVNMAYSSTNVTYGRGEGIVVATGMKTQVGKIALMLNNADETITPLQKNLNQLGRVLTILILIIAVIIFIVGVVLNREHLPFNKLILNMFLVAVSLAVAAIPEGLPATVTIILALGTQRMAKHKAIIRKLPAVETLGATDIIASDKTGTLTQNRMTVEKLYHDGQLHDATDKVSDNNPAILSMILANDTKIENGGDLLGDPTETALIQYGLDEGVDLSNLLKKYNRVQELPFDSERKLMSTVNNYVEGKYYVAVKGAPDVLLDRITQIERNGKVQPITTTEKSAILQVNKDLASQALRVLGLAYKIIDQPYDQPNTDNMERDLIFAGLVGMIDPQRPEAQAAVAQAQKAGIRTIMITGDHQVTAQAIAERLGIIEPGQTDRVVTGAQLDEMTSDYFDQHVTDYSVYARVSPEHKVRIVKAWQGKDKIVAMTGDGVNDAPSLKQADIGIGMGVTGTEVSKGASDMILADDNFATIVAAVKEGRKVFANIQKAILYLMSSNVGEVLTVFLMTLLGWDILQPVQLLWINLVTDTLPAIALGVEPAEQGIMERKPRGKKSNFFSGGVASSIAYQGILEGVLVLLTYQIGLHIGPHVGQEAHGDALTMAFLSLALIQLFHAFNSKSIHQSIFNKQTFANKWFNWAILISALTLVAVELPFLNKLFLVTELDLEQWLVVISSAFAMVIIVEIVKFFQRRMGKK